MSSGWIELPITASTGVTSINGDTGALFLVAGSGISIIDSPTGTFTISATGGGGTVTSVSVVTANGLAGTVANPTTTPALTLSTTVTGILEGNGTAISAATTGNLTDVGTDGITITGGTGSVLGSGTTISQHVADTTHNGYLSSTDWNTFNSKGSGTVSTVGTIDTNANSNGLFISGNAISTQSASISNPGMVNNTTQSMSGAKTFTGNLTASASSTTALTVGTNTLIADTTNGLVGINVAPAAGNILDAVGSTTSAVQNLQITGYGVNNVGLRVRHARGTSGSPTAIQSGDVIAFLGGRGYGTTGFINQNTGSINYLATENFSDTAGGTGIVFKTTANTTISLLETMRLNSTGNLLIGTTTDNGTSKLQVQGSLALNGSVSGTHTVSAAATTTSYSNVLPAAQGAAGSVMQNDGSGNLSWTTSGSSFLTSGTTYTTPTTITAATKFKFTLIGGGGAGSGSSSVSQNGSGGGAGGTVIVYVSGLTANTGYTYAIGAGGTPASAASGGNGGNTTLTIGGTTYTAGLGTGGTIGLRQPGGAGGTTTNGTIGIPGQAGGPTNTATTCSGYGGSTMFGSGGTGIPVPATAQTTGNSGTGFGSAGGSAASAGTGGNATGGAGMPGCILVEYYN